MLEITMSVVLMVLVAAVAVPPFLAQGDPSVGQEASCLCTADETGAASDCIEFSRSVAGAQVLDENGDGVVTCEELEPARSADVSSGLAQAGDS